MSFNSKNWRKRRRESWSIRVWIFLKLLEEEKVDKIQETSLGETRVKNKADYKHLKISWTLTKPKKATIGFEEIFQ